MKRDIICKSSVFKHKVTLDNIRHVLDYLFTFAQGIGGAYV
jgi:hypothetical protein